MRMALNCSRLSPEFPLSSYSSVIIVSNPMDSNTAEASTMGWTPGLGTLGLNMAGSHPGCYQHLCCKKPNICRSSCKRGHRRTAGAMPALHRRNTMNPKLLFSLPAVALTGIALFWPCSVPAGGMPPTSGYTVLAPIRHGNLTVFPVLAAHSFDTEEFLTLDEGLRSGEDRK